MINKKIDYFEYSNNLIVGIIFISPFLFLYEFLCIYFFNNSSYQVRNTADIFISSFFQFLGPFSNLIYAFSLILTIVLIYFFHKKKNRVFKIIPFYLFLILFEGIIYGYILSILINNIAIFSIEMLYQSNLLINLYLSIGAGIWEEVLFRLVIFNLLIYLFNYFTNFNLWFKVLISVLFTSLFFSMFHYIGSGADMFLFDSFFYRFLGGIFLTTLYYFRGFGVTCMCHLSYDFILVSLPLI